MKTNRRTNKLKSRQAEVAAEHWLRESMGCVAIRRAVRTKWQAVDFFGADLVGVLDTGAKIYVQVTTGGHSAMSTRRAKLGAFPWHASETVLLLNLVATASAAKGRRTEYWFRIEEYCSTMCESGRPMCESRRRWQDWPDAYRVPREWFMRGAASR